MTGWTKRTENKGRLIAGAVVMTGVVMALAAADALSVAFGMALHGTGEPERRDDE